WHREEGRRLRRRGGGPGRRRQGRLNGVAPHQTTGRKARCLVGVRFPGVHAFRPPCAPVHSAVERITSRARKSSMPAYQRILLKLSGEALMGDDAFGINRGTIVRIVDEIAEVTRLG